MKFLRFIIESRNGCCFVGNFVSYFDYDKPKSSFCEQSLSSFGHKSTLLDSFTIFIELKNILEQLSVQHHQFHPIMPVHEFGRHSKGPVAIKPNK